jgi:hypothetical protein
VLESLVQQVRSVERVVVEELVVCVAGWVHQVWGRLLDCGAVLRWTETNWFFIILSKPWLNAGKPEACLPHN